MLEKFIAFPKNANLHTYYIFMNIFSSITEAIRDISNYRKYQKVINSIYKETDFINALNMSFGVKFQIDNIGCLYAVINPYIQNMGETGNNIIYDGNGNKLIDQWVLGNFDIIDRVIKNHELFDILSYDIQKIDDDLNYLLVIQNAMTPFYKKAKLKMGCLGGVFSAILLVILAIFL